MSNLPSAEVSPRIVNGVIYFYQGDTFSLQFEFFIEDQDGEPITISPTDTIKVVFKDSRKHAVKEFIFNEIRENVITVLFDESVTELFQEGQYTYDIYYKNDAERVTVANDSKVVVE